jgi:hypothetical protein
MRTRLLAGGVLVAVAFAVAACGSSHSSARSTGEHRKPKIPSFDPAHHYSVTDVERAFAAHGIRFTAERRRKPGSVCDAVCRHIRSELPRDLVGLRAGSMPHAVFATVVTGSRFRWPAFVAGYQGKEHFSTITRRNVMVVFDSAQRAAVRAALAQL